MRIMLFSKIQYDGASGAEIHGYPELQKILFPNLDIICEMFGHKKSRVCITTAFKYILVTYYTLGITLT